MSFLGEPPRSGQRIMCLYGNWVIFIRENMITPRACLLPSCLLLLLVSFSEFAIAAEKERDQGWKPLFNGKNLDGWYIVIRNSRSDDTNHLVQIDDGAIHMYKDAPGGSAQPVGYIVTD